MVPALGETSGQSVGWGRAPYTTSIPPTTHVRNQCCHDGGQYPPHAVWPHCIRLSPSSPLTINRLWRVIVEGCHLPNMGCPHCWETTTTLSVPRLTQSRAPCTGQLTNGQAFGAKLGSWGPTSNGPSLDSWGQRLAMPSPQSGPGTTL